MFPFHDNPITRLIEVGDSGKRILEAEIDSGSAISLIHINCVEGLEVEMCEATMDLKKRGLVGLNDAEISLPIGSVEVKVSDIASGCFAKGRILVVDYDMDFPMLLGRNILESFDLKSFDTERIEKRMTEFLGVPPKVKIKKQTSKDINNIPKEFLTNYDVWTSELKEAGNIKGYEFEIFLSPGAKEKGPHVNTYRKKEDLH